MNTTYRIGLQTKRVQVRESEVMPGRCLCKPRRRRNSRPASVTDCTIRHKQSRRKERRSRICDARPSCFARHVTSRCVHTASGGRFQTAPDVTTTHCHRLCRPVSAHNANYLTYQWRSNVKLVPEALECRGPRVPGKIINRFADFRP